SPQIIGILSWAAAALAMLARRDYSRAVLAQRLARKGYGSQIVAVVCERCAKAGYLDDRRFGRARLEARLERRPCGRSDAFDDLRRQGLAVTMCEKVVDESFAAMGGEKVILESAMNHWQARHGEPVGLASAKRCFDHLMRRRFPRYLVLQVLSPWLDSLAD
ncbi:MAG: regulatory protein RecX, partial [Acidobacteriota bacterium]